MPCPQVRESLPALNNTHEHFSTLVRSTNVKGRLTAAVPPGTFARVIPYSGSTMRFLPHIPVALCAVLLAIVTPTLAGQQAPTAVGDLLADVADMESKITSLATALPEAAWTWKPSDGVRSSAEVIVHVAGDNYLMPGVLGATTPPATGINPQQPTTVAAFEGRLRTRAQAMAELAASFAFLKQHLSATSDAQLTESLTLFGRPTTRRATWLAAVTHLHEHLGQLIAYARVDDVVPPWSR